MMVWHLQGDGAQGTQSKAICRWGVRGQELIPVRLRNETNNCRRRGDESLIRVHSTRKKEIRDSSPRLLQWLVRCVSLILRLDWN
jgi:hypothetical protein